MAKRIILNMGHRDLTGGGTAGGGLTERNTTDDIVLAIQRAMKAAGVEVFINQELDGDSDPTMLNKNLDYVGRTADAIDKQYGPVDAYLSIHLEGSTQPGLFAIVPDGAGLIAAATGRGDVGDTWADNPKDVAFARALAKHCAAATGLGLRATTEPGVMSERATGVGGQGWRLSEFHETMPIREHATRNILECGAMPNSNDIKIISAPGFPDKIAKGVVAAFAEVFGLDSTPAEPPKDQYAKPLPLPFRLGIDLGWGYSLNGCPVNLFVTEVEALKGVVPRAWASAKAPKSAPTIPVKTKFSIYGDCITGDKKQWFFLEDGSRIEARGVTPIIKFRKR